MSDRRSFIEACAPHNRDGYVAALAGRPASSNPWKPGTVGHAAWAFGWDCGRVVRPVERLVRMLSVLTVVLPWRRR